MQRESIARLIYFVAVCSLFAVVFMLLLSTNMQKELSHDEHMYVAGGALLAREGMLPYRDFHYLQTPYLAFVYAALFQVSDHLLLAARLFNTLCAVLSLCVIYLIASRLFQGAGYLVRFLMGAGSVVLTLASPIFVYASGLAWNHDLPLLLLLAAVALFVSGVEKPRMGLRLFLAGMLVGCAIGTRLSYLLTAVPFAFGALMLHGVTQWRRRFLLLGALLSGVVTALVPALVLFVLAPGNALFDNLSYHQLNEVYWQQQGYTRAMDLPGKLSYLLDVALEPATLALLVACLCVLPVAVWAVWKQRTGYAAFAFTLSVIPCLLVGALVPTSTWYQYFYALVPFLVLGVAYGVAYLYSLGGWRRWVLAPFGALVLICVVYEVPGYSKLNKSLLADDWVPVKAHKIGMEIKQAMGDGRVLTLSPLFPLEGGLDIYEELAAGPFLWRTSSLLSDDERLRLEALLGDSPPKGILVGSEPGLDDPLVRYAQERGYRPITLSNSAVLWIHP